MTQRQSPLLFCGLFDFFALWLASDVPSTELQVNYDLMSCKIDARHLTSVTCTKAQVLKRTLVLHEVFSAKLKTRTSANICNICAHMSAYPWVYGKQNPYDWR